MSNNNNCKVSLLKGSKINNELMSSILSLAAKLEIEKKKKKKEIISFMERVNFQVIEKSGKKNLINKNFIIPKVKNFIV